MGDCSSSELFPGWISDIQAEPVTRQWRLGPALSHSQEEESAMACVLSLYLIFFRGKTEKILGILRELNISITIN